MSIVQSVLLRRDMFTLPEAIQWIKEHGYTATKIDKTPIMYRFRQVDPQALTHYRFRTIRLGDVGDLIVSYPPKK